MSQPTSSGPGHAVHPAIGSQRHVSNQQQAAASCAHASALHNAQLGPRQSKSISSPSEPVSNAAGRLKPPLLHAPRFTQLFCSDLPKHPPAPTGGPAAANGGTARPASAPPINTSLPGDADDPSQYPFWNVRRYRPLFNVDTKVGLGAAGERVHGWGNPHHTLHDFLGSACRRCPALFLLAEPCSSSAMQIQPNQRDCMMCHVVHSSLC